MPTLHFRLVDYLASSLLVNPLLFLDMPQGPLSRPKRYSKDSGQESPDSQSFPVLLYVGFFWISLAWQVGHLAFTLVTSFPLLACLLFIPTLFFISLGLLPLIAWAALCLLSAE